jgi:glycosyltransferase involved in cell wall biosynthesis
VRLAGPRQASSDVPMTKLITNTGERCFLEICIPTYKRRAELSRLLGVLEREVNSLSERVTLRIAISDNSSPDDTQAMLRDHPLRERLVVRTQPSNIGALLNIWGLYERANAEYVWIICDDDIPKPGSLARIIRTLSVFRPAVVTFEFEQPPRSTTRRHGDREGVEELTDLVKGVPHLLVLGKLTKYVVDGTHLPSVLRNLEGLKNTGYGWQAVILEALRLADRKTIVLDHEFLAGCDDNYAQLTDGLIPSFWDDYLLVLDHPIVRENCPEYADSYRRRHGRYMVRMIYSVLAGVIRSEKVDAFEKKGRELSFDKRYLGNPFVLLQWLSLRTGLPAARFVWAAENWSMAFARRLLRPFRRSAPER